MGGEEGGVHYSCTVGKRLDKKVKVFFKICDTINSETIAVYILANLSRSKENQIMKFSQVIEYNMRRIFFKNRTENETGRLVPHLFVF